MGHFLAVSAFRNTREEDLIEALCDCMNQHELSVEIRSEKEPPPDERVDAVVFQPMGSWRIILWPEFFNVHDFPVCQALSRSSTTLVSTVHTYDGDYWAHGLFLNGRLLDQFASMPNYFEENPDLRQKWKGDSALIAETFGIEQSRIQGYLVHDLEVFDVPSWKRLFSAQRRRGPVKVHPSDEFTIDNMWVFTDFWKQLGIEYPEPVVNQMSKIIQLGADFQDKLPEGPER